MPKENPRDPSKMSLQFVLQAAAKGLQAFSDEVTRFPGFVQSTYEDVRSLPVRDQVFLGLGCTLSAIFTRNMLYYNPGSYQWGCEDAANNIFGAGSNEAQQYIDNHCPQASMFGLL